MVQVTGRVLFEDGTVLSARVSTPTVELWSAAQEGISTRREQRLDFGQVSEKGLYVVTGPDGTNLRVEVRGVSRAIADLPDPDDLTTAPRARKIKQDFLIPSPHKVTGRVVDSQDQPIAPATVSLRSDDVKTDGWYYGNQQTTVTAAGEFTLDGVAAGAAVIGAAAPGYSAFTQEIAVPTSGALTLRLTTGTATVNGHVLQFPSDAPLAGAKVRMEPTGMSKTLGLSGGSKMEAVAAADGSFAFNNLSAGPYQFLITAADGSELFAAPGKENQAAMAPTLFDSQTTGIALRVFPGYTISGLVFDKDTSEPLAGARVAVYRGSTAMRQEETKADGRYEIERVGPDWKSDLGVQRDGYMISPSAQLSFRNHATAALQVTYPDTSDRIALDAPMVAVVRVTGRVENKEGLPVPNARVDWNANSSYPATRDHNQVTDADGRFRFSLLPFQEGLFEVTAEGYAFKRSDEVKLTTLDRNDIVIVVDAGAAVDGQVVNPKGEGVAFASVSIRDHYSIGFSQMMAMRPLAKSEADGSFHVENLPAQENIRLNATAAGYSPGLAVVHLQPGETKAGVRIELGEELTIEGRVLDPDDKPVQAQIHPFGGVASTIAHTDANGAFKLGGLSPGAVQLFVVPTGGSPETINTEVPKKDLIIRIGDDPCTAICTVVDSVTKQPIEEFEVNGAGGVKHLGPGKFSLKLGPKESYTPKITAEGYVPRTFRVAAPEEPGDFEMTLEMGIGSGVSGRVVHGNGEPARGVPVAVYEGDFFAPTPTGTSVSGEDGKFLISKVPAGKISVSAMPPPPEAKASKTVDLTDGQFQDVGDLIIGQVGAISGRIVRMPSGEPVAEMYVNINGVGDGDQFYKLIVTKEDGLFQLADLQPRSYSINANGHLQQVEVKSGETAQVTVEIGSSTLRGTITRAGSPTGAVIKATSKATGKTVSHNANTDTGVYSLSGLTPGDYDVEIQPLIKRKDGTQTSDNAPANYTETITVPDQESVQRDFSLP
jgi:hypothetical protein